MNNIIGRIELPTANRTISLSALQNKIINKLNTRSGKTTYLEHYHSVSEVLRESLPEYSKIVTNDGVEYEVNYIMKERLERNPQIIENVIYNYSQGKVSTAFRNLVKCISSIIDGDKIMPYRIKKGDIFYRMRKNEDHLYDSKELFHIPFEKRGIIKGNNRYSIAGFPCLYLNTSVYGCWTEINPDNLNQVSVSRLVAKKELSLIDLRYYQDIRDKEHLCKYLEILPLIIACSIRAENRESFYIPEYIVPQMILHTVVKAPNNFEQYDGIAYTPMVDVGKCKIDYKKTNTSIVIPVTKITNNGLCSNLINIFPISSPICVSHKMERLSVKNHLSMISDYNKTVFGKLERDLSLIDTKELKNK